MVDSKRLSVLSQEVVVIVVGILLAFGFDAVWTSWDDRARERYHVQALHTDFRSTIALLEESLETTVRGRESAFRALAEMQAGRLQERTDSVLAWAFYAVNYEVFRPQRGAYDALVNSGEFGLLRSDSLRSALAAYFGTFDDARASERILLDDHREFFHSAVGVEILRFDRLLAAAIFGETPVATPTQAAALAGSDEFRGWMAALAKDHLDLTDDYTTLMSDAETVLDLLEASR